LAICSSGDRCTSDAAGGEQVPWLGAALGDQAGPGPADQADGEPDDRLQLAEQASGVHGAAAGAEDDQPAERVEGLDAALDEFASDAVEDQGRLTCRGVGPRIAALYSCVGLDVPHDDDDLPVEQVEDRPVGGVPKRLRQPFELIPGSVREAKDRVTH
jgi:hypothetical protein